MTDADGPGRGVGLIVVNYGSHRLVERHLVDLKAGAPDVRFIVVDSFKSVGDREAIAAVASEQGFQMLPLDTNPGFGSAANAGAAAAVASGCDTLVFLNPDASLTPAGLREVVERSRALGHGMLAPLIVRTDGSTWFDGGLDDRRTGIPGRIPGSGEEIRWLTGACLVVSSSTWELLGGFDEEYFLYWEDVDLSHRCALSGGRLEICSDVVAVHEVGATQEGTGKSPLYVRHCCRNRLLFASKHLSRREMLRWVVATPRSSWLIARRGTRRTRLVRSPALLWAMLSGSLAGLARTIPPMLFGRRSTRPDQVETA